MMEAMDWAATLDPDEAAREAKKGEDLEGLVEEALKVLLLNAQEHQLLDPPYGRINPEELLERLHAEVDAAMV